jgi:uncharacterized membrane protein HdeD (DUF308 family)
MLQIPNPHEELLQRFSKNSMIAGIVFVVLGLIGIFFPVFMSVTSALFFGWLLLFTGFLAGMHTYTTSRGDWLGWLKTFILVVTGAMLVVNPAPGIAALGIIFAVYFMFDAFNSTAVAFQMRPAPMWWVMLINGIVSLVLAIIFLANWPMGSMVLVGLFIGISLFFDGIALLAISRGVKKL